jgi:hypothetical protein
MLVVAFAAFIVESHDAFSAHDESQPVLVGMRAAPHGRRHKLHFHFDKGGLRQDHAPVEQKFRLHAARDALPAKCCQLLQHKIG